MESDGIIIQPLIQGKSGLEKSLDIICKLFNYGKNERHTLQIALENLAHKKRLDKEYLRRILGDFLPGIVNVTAKYLEINEQMLYSLLDKKAISTDVFPDVLDYYLGEKHLDKPRQLYEHLSIANANINDIKSLELDRWELVGIDKRNKENFSTFYFKRKRKKSKNK